MSEPRPEGNKNNSQHGAKLLIDFKTLYHGARGILLLDHPLLRKLNVNKRNKKSIFTVRLTSLFTANQSRI